VPTPVLHTLEPTACRCRFFLVKLRRLLGASSVHSCSLVPSTGPTTTLYTRSNEVPRYIPGCWRAEKRPRLEKNATLAPMPKVHYREKRHDPALGNWVTSLIKNGWVRTWIKLAGESMEVPNVWFPCPRLSLHQDPAQCRVDRLKSQRSVPGAPSFAVDAC